METQYRHYLTTAQVADVFRVDISTVNRWCQNGHLESAKFGTGRTAPRMYDHDDVIAFGDRLAALAERAA